MSAPFLSLGFFKPERWNARQIGYELTARTQSLGLTPHIDPAHGPLPLKGRNWASVHLHAEVRRRTFKTAQAESFHWDGDLEPDAKPDCGIVLWASNHPTEIKWRNGDGTIYQPRPYEVVVFANLCCLHRRPANCPRVRWIYRQRVALPPDWRLNLGLSSGATK
jgi:hypothetical protein